MFVEKNKAQVLTSGPATVREYGGTERLDLATAKITGRYPPKGWVRNTKVDMTYFCISGRGVVYVEEDSFEVGPRDLVMIEAGKWYWAKSEGDEPMEVVMASSPAWSPEQYEEKDS